jgi:hypothetical protein
MQRVEVRGKPEKNWVLPVVLSLVVLTTLGWLGRNHMKNPAASGKSKATTATAAAKTSPQIARQTRLEDAGRRFERHATLKEFMEKDLKLSTRQIRKYDEYVSYYKDKIQRVDRIENRYRTQQVDKLSRERERILVGLLGQRNVDLILWWAEGSRLTPAEWLRQRDLQRRSASQRKIASR